MFGGAEQSDASGTLRPHPAALEVEMQRLTRTDGICLWRGLFCSRDGEYASPALEGGRERSTLLVGTFHMYTYMEEQGVGLRREPYYQIKMKLDSNHVKCHQQMMSLTKAALWY